MTIEAAVKELIDAAFRQFGGRGDAGARIIRPRSKSRGRK